MVVSTLHLGEGSIGLAKWWVRTGVKPLQVD